MAVGHTAGRLAAVLTVAAGLVLVGAAPALAAPYSVGLGLPRSFRVDGSPGSVTVKITKGEDGCVYARWGVTVRLDGLSPDQLAVERSVEGSWRTVGLQSVGDGGVAFGSDGRLCKGRAISARYRVTFLAGAPTGEAMFAARASVFGRPIGSDAGTRKVLPARNAEPSPSDSPSPSESPSATPAADPTGAAVVGAAPTPAAAGGSGGSGGGFLSGVSLIIMIFGLLMVGIGGAILYLIIGKMRAEPDVDGPLVDPAATTMVLPRVPRVPPH